MENLMRRRGIVLYTGIVLAVMPCLMVSAAPPRLAGLSTTAKDSKSSLRYAGNHINSVYSALPSESQKPFHLQRLPEKVPSPNFPGIESSSYQEGVDVEYPRHSYPYPNPYRQPHEYLQERGIVNGGSSGVVESTESVEELVIPKFPAFSPELENARTEGSLGPLSLLEQLAPQLW